VAVGGGVGAKGSKGLAMVMICDDLVF
jgi:hypothetical protein